MQLLVSPINLKEALECVQANVDIIDVKNPKEGSLGANFPWVIKAIRENVPSNIPISATIGDVPFKPGTVALAALGAATAGASFVKVGLLGTSSIAEAIEVMTAVTKTIWEFNLPTAIVAAGYAEGETIGSVSPMKIPLIASKSACQYAMIDTYDKTAGKSLFDYLSTTKLMNFIINAQESNLKVALGGSITIKNLPSLKKLKPDIIGIRGAVCESGNRLDGSIKADLIEDFIAKMKE